MIKNLVAVPHIPLMALRSLDVGNTTGSLDAYRVARLPVDEVLCDVFRIELLPLELGCVVVKVVCCLCVLVVVYELAKGLVPDGLVEGVHHGGRCRQLAR